jgi:hypothetical protein
MSELPNDSPSDLPEDPAPVPGHSGCLGPLTRLLTMVFVLLLTIECFAFSMIIRIVVFPRGPAGRSLLFAALFFLMFLLPLIVAGGLLAVVGFANLRRRRQLERYHAEHPEARSRERTTASPRWGWTLCGAMAVGSLPLWLPDGPPHTAEHVDAEQGGFELPVDATDVSYYRHDAWIAYEFTTREQSFRQWIMSERFAPEPSLPRADVKEITEPHGVVRYLRGVRLEAGKQVDDHGEDEATVTEGLKYGWSIEDRGVHAAFDRKTNRAYLYIHFY